ncbi:SGNH/GDSL hydrolase family protein [Rheinheimera faecalis]|uniref:hypothetical protein n=1 Tax=Rheinheimera faecalis TaxID=2901141 RepID=UPI001E55651D|nr:hypothetical protein [Rheinheimera faecalis]
MNTYASIIQQELKGAVHVHNLAYGDRCSADYVAESFVKTYVKSANARYVVLQLGIVDCAPRLLTTLERAVGYLARKSRFSNSLFNYYIRWKSKHRMFFTKWFPMTRVKINAYESNMKRIIENFSENNDVDRFFVINIAYPGEGLISKSFGIVENIEKYNSVLNTISLTSDGKVKVIDLYSETRTNKNWITIDDGHHIKSEAHSWIAESILHTIGELSE